MTANVQLPLSREELIGKVNDKRLADKVRAKRAATENSEPEEEEIPYSFNQLGTDVKHVSKGLGEAAVDLVDTPYNLKQLTNLAPEGVRDFYGNAFDLSPIGVASNAYNSLRERSPSLPAIPSVLTGDSAISDLPGLSQAKELLASKEEGASEGADSLRKGVTWGAGGVRKAGMKAADIVPDLMMGVGAATGDYFSDWISKNDNPIGEMLGGATALIASLIRGKTKAATAGAVAAVDEISEGGNVAAKVREAGDEVGTLADVTGDSGLYDLQATLNATPKGARALDRKEASRQQQIAEEVRQPFGDASTDTAQEVAGEYIDEVIDKTRARTQRQSSAAEVPYRQPQLVLDQSDAATQRAAADAAEAELIAQEGLAKARESIDTNQTLAQSGEGMHAVATAEKKIDDDAAAVLWGEFNVGPNIKLAPISAAIDEFLGGLSQAKVDAFKKKYADRLEWKDDIDDLLPEDIHTKIKDLKKDLTIAYKQDGGAKDVDLTFGAVIDVLDDSVAKSNSSYDAAREATSAIYKRWGQRGTPIQNALAGPKETFGKSIPLGGEVGAYHARLLNHADIPGMPAKIAERLKSLARRSKSGIDEDFILEYESLMDAMPPAFRRQADEFVRAGQDLDSAAGLSKSTLAVSEAAVKASNAERKVLSKALDADKTAIAEGGERLEKSIGNTNLAQYLTNPTKTISGLIKGGDSKGIKALARQIESRGPEALASFKSKVGEDLLSILSSTSSNKAGIRAMDGLAAPIEPKAFEAFFDMRNTLIESGLIDSSTADKISKALKKTRSSSLRANGTSRLFGTTTQGSDLAASGLAVFADKLIPGSGSSLVMVGAFRRFFKKFTNRIGDNTQAHKILNEMILDPQKYLKGIESAKNLEDAVRMITSKINASAQTISISAEALTEE